MATQFSRSQLATKMSKSAKRKTQKTRMILLITFLYIGVSLPGISITGWLFGTIIKMEGGVLIVNLLNCFQFSYPTFSFLILYFSNKLFAKETRLIFNKIIERYRKVSNIPKYLN